MRQLFVSLALTALFLVSAACGITTSTADLDVSSAEDAFSDGRYLEAIDELEQALQGDLQQHEPEYVHYLIGLSYDRLDEYDQAIAAYQQALEINPEYTEAWLGLGVVQRLSGDFEAARAAYQEALRLNPDLAEAHSSLGTLYVLEDQPEAAINEFEEAIRLNPELATAHSNLAVAYAMVGRFEDADRALARAVELGYASGDEIQQQIDELKALDK